MLRTHPTKEVVKAYIKHINRNTPTDIMSLLYSFCGTIITIFNVYKSDRTGFMDKCIYFGVFGGSYFFMDVDSALFVGGFANKYLKLKKSSINYLIKRKHFKCSDIELISNSCINGNHCFIYTKSKELYGFGKNDRCQVGIETSNDEIIIQPRLIEYNFDSELIRISYGDNHTLFLTKMGNVYACGNNSNGELSKHYNICKNGNIIVNILDTNNIRSIGCCSMSSYVLNDDNKVCSFGDNSYGELGIKNESITFCNNLNSIDIKDVDVFNCGCYHIGILTLNNELYMFGLNANKQCGSPYGTSCPYGNKILLNNNEIIMDIKCGNNHNIITTKKYQFYSFGCNQDNQLLIQHDKAAQYTPTLIKKSYLYSLTYSENEIIDLIPGWNQTFIIQKSQN